MLVLGLLLPWSVIPDVSGAAPAAAKGAAYKHAYYVFLSGTPVGCEDCYVPLLTLRNLLRR
jgi:hypothetical protein